MTGYTVHTGSSEKFSEGWDQIFKQSPPKKTAQKAEKPATAKKVNTPKKSKQK